MTLETLARRAAELGVCLDEGQLASFETYRDQLLRWNRRVNLTGIRTSDDVEVRHFVDSLSCLMALDDLPRGGGPIRLIDVGSGGGFPGLPLRLACPSIRLTLLDSVGKKTAFLQHLVDELGLEDVEVVTGRAEDLAQSPEYRERFDVATARALAPLPVLLELCLPFVRVGGRVIASRRGNLEAQQRDAAAALRELGGAARAPVAVDLGPGLEEYGLVVVDKVTESPPQYPRRAGLPAKRPLV
jgi:16S rRNA (guanine527-N7)-methyltransferase